MKRLLTPVILGLMLCSGAKAQVAQVDGDTLYRWCVDDELACTAFIQGFIEGHARADYYSARRYSALCIPSGATVGQAVDIAQQYLARHPEDRHLTSGYLLMRAFLAVWPMRESTCKIGYDEGAAPN